MTLLCFGMLTIGAVPSGAMGPLVLEPEYVFDGEEMHRGWVVVIANGKIQAAGVETDAAVRNSVQLIAESDVAPERLRLQGQTILPGLIDAHSHLLLHPYDETSWTDQVLRESHAERVARATVHAKAALLAGFTTLRDLGSEGAGYADVGLRDALRKGVILGPRIQVAGRALVATGSYGPKGFGPHVTVPLGAEQADGDDLTRVVRDQIGQGIDVVKVYADYRWGPAGEAKPTYSLAELERIVEIATDSGRPTVAHASTAEAMRRATLAGVRTIEHGDGGTPEVFALMAERGVALCPTIAAGDAISRYRGWDGEEPEPTRIVAKRASVRAAINAGVEICAGGDSGVFAHGDNARELELMVEYGMSPIEVLRSATSLNARLLGFQGQIGRVASGYVADLIAVRGQPSENIQALHEVELVVQAGRVVLRTSQ